jgi:membrane protein YqaA with SNARE-associated domain
MRALLNSFLGYFLTPFGLVLLGTLDSSVIFYLPLGIDFAVIILSARNPELFWLYALLATAGSLIGAAGTFWIGQKLGEHGLSRLVSPSRLTHIEAWVSKGAAISVGVLAVIPPPFPFTPFVLTSGALRANPWTFLLAMAGARLARFGVEAGLAARHGRRILSWMETSTFELIVGILIVLAVAGTIVSAVAVARGTRRPHQSDRESQQGRNAPIGREQ